MLYLNSLEPRVKRWAIITFKHGIYEVPHEMMNDWVVGGGGNFTPQLIFPKKKKKGKSCNPEILQRSITFC